MGGEFGFVAGFCIAEFLLGGLFLCVVVGLESGEAFGIVGVEEKIFENILIGCLADAAPVHGFKSRSAQDFAPQWRKIHINNNGLHTASKFISCFSAHYAA